MTLTPNETISVSILHQDKEWLPYGATEPVKIKKMDPQHVAYLLKFLERRKKALKYVDDWRATWDAASHDGGEMAQDALDDIADRLMNQPVDEWFEELPLIIKLRKLVKKYNRTLHIDVLDDIVARYRYDIAFDKTHPDYIGMSDQEQALSDMFFKPPRT